MFYSTSKLLEDRHSSTYLQEYTLSEHVLIQIKWKFWILEKNAQGKTNQHKKKIPPSASPSMDCNILQIFFEVLNYTPVIGVWGFLLFVLSFISCYWFFPFISFFFQFYILHKQFFKNEILSAITNEPNWITKLWFWKWPFYNTKQYFIIRICYHFIVRLCLISSWFSTTGLFDFY